MPDGHRATFSIYDHRTDLYRRVLLLFDLIVVLIPIEPIGRLSCQEIDQLSTEIDCLAAKESCGALRLEPE